MFQPIRGNRVRGLVKFAWAAVAVVSSASLGHATPLPPGSTLSPIPAGVIPSGTIVASGTSPFLSASFSGTLFTEVLWSDPSNPLGGLTFRYSLQEDAGSSDAIEQFSVNTFAGAALDVHFVAVPGGNIQTPALVHRSNGGGSTIGFSFLDPPTGTGRLQPGQSSVPLVVYTNSHVFAAMVAIVSDGSSSIVSTFATPALPGDVNLDGVVNGLDVSLVAANWLHAGNGVPGDANYDSVVNGLDVSQIASHWLTHVPPGTAVPEPSTGLMALAAWLAVGIFRLPAPHRFRAR